MGWDLYLHFDYDSTNQLRTFRIDRYETKVLGGTYTEEGRSIPINKPFDIPKKRITVFVSGKTMTGNFRMRLGRGFLITNPDYGFKENEFNLYMIWQTSESKNINAIVAKLKEWNPAIRYQDIFVATASNFGVLKREEV
jgi:hypothetical protein